MEAIAPASSEFHKRSEIGPWRSLGRAVKWVFLAALVALAIALMPIFLGLLTHATGHGQGTETAQSVAAWARYGTVGMQLMLLWGAVRGARTVAPGSVSPGSSNAGSISNSLGNQPIQNPRLVALFAALMLTWDAVAIGTLAWIVSHGGNAPVVPTQFAGIPHTIIGAVVFIVLLTFLAPLSEELFFRGWLWGALRKSWSPAWTLIGTSGLWMAVHFLDGTLRALLLLPTGVLLGLARYYGGSIRASLVLHIINNSLVVLLQLAVLLAG